MRRFQLLYQSHTQIHNTCLFCLLMVILLGRILFAFSDELSTLGLSVEQFPLSFGFLLDRTIIFDDRECLAMYLGIIFILAGLQLCQTDHNLAVLRPVGKILGRMRGMVQWQAGKIILKMSIGISDGFLLPRCEIIFEGYDLLLACAHSIRCVIIVS